MESRRKQPAISFRSRKALERLRLLTRDGRSQAEVIEQALAREPVPQINVLNDEKRAQQTFDKIMAIVAKIPAGNGRTMAEFDAEEYDEDGLPR